MEGSILSDLISIGFCLLFSGFFSATETALTSLSDIKVKHILSEKGNKAKQLEIWLNHPNKVLNTILIGNNIANILGSVLAARLVGQIFDNATIAVTTGVMTLLVLIFGEITPKTFAKHNAESFALISLRILKIFYIILYPFTHILNILVSVTIKLMGGSIKNDGPTITEDELEFMIEEGGKEGVLEDQQKEMLQNIFDISDTYTKEVMVSRTDMLAIEDDTPLDALLEIVADAEHSRIPIYKERLDNIIGVLYVKDLLKYIKLDKSEIKITEIMREPHFVPETKKIDDLLKDFQFSRVHLAIVIDEYGGVAGIVTLEDVLEEIVGEIRDEYDEDEEDDIVQIKKGLYHVDARLDIDDFCEYFEIEKTEDMEEYETFGGLIYDLAGNIPERGNHFKLLNFEFCVLETDGRKLEKIEVKKIEVEELEKDE